MLIMQFEVKNSTEDEKLLIPEFCSWLIDQMYEYLDTDINKKKIELRFDYIYQNCEWIRWSNKKYLNINAIMQAIYKSFDFNQFKLNTWRINTNKNILIPNTYTQIDKLIRFINSGDGKIKGIGIFINLQRYFNHKKLNHLYQFFMIRQLGYMPEAKIITDRE